MFTSRRLPHFFTQHDNLLLGLSTGNIHKFVIYATDFTSYWAATYRHKHLDQGSHEAVNIKGLLEALCVSFDSGEAVSSYEISENEATLKLVLAYTQHHVEHKVGVTLSLVEGETRSHLITNIMLELYFALDDWRRKAKSNEKMKAFHKSTLTRQHANTSPLEKATITPVKKSYSPLPLRETEINSKEEMNKAIKDLETQSRVRGWKPVNACPRSFHDTTQSLPSLPSIFPSGSPNSRQSVVLSAVASSTPSSASIFRLPARSIETKEQLKVKVIRQKQQLLALQEFVEQQDKALRYQLQQTETTAEVRSNSTFVIEMEGQQPLLENRQSPVEGAASSSIQEQASSHQPLAEDSPLSAVTETSQPQPASSSPDESPKLTDSTAFENPSNGSVDIEQNPESPSSQLVEET